MSLAKRIASLGMTFVMFIAIVAAGFAHKWQETPQVFDPAIQSFLKAGGSISDICGTERSGDSAANTECDACLIKSGFALPGRLGTACPRADRWTILPVSHAEQVRLLHIFDLSRASRAPPTA